MGERSINESYWFKHSNILIKYILLFYYASIYITHKIVIYTNVNWDILPIYKNKMSAPEYLLTPLFFQLVSQW